MILEVPMKEKRAGLASDLSRESAARHGFAGFVPMDTLCVGPSHIAGWACRALGMRGWLLLSP